jgi:hypothetical protein
MRSAEFGKRLAGTLAPPGMVQANTGKSRLEGGIIKLSDWRGGDGRFRAV